ncbi:MAG TPA: hypothetical protein VF862_05650 [Gemmatimonadales bacterium]
MRWARGAGPVALQVPARVAVERGPGWVPWPMPSRLVALERRMSAWLHPTYRGAVCWFGLGAGVAGKLYGFLLLATLMVMVGPGPGVVLFLKVLGVAVIAGAVGGTMHGVLRSLDRWGRMGTWLRGLTAIFVALMAAVALTPRGPFNLPDPMLHLFALGLAALGAGGLLLLDDRRPGRPTPGHYQDLLRRDRLWTTADRARSRRRP